MRMTLGVLIAKKTAENDDRFRIRTWVESGNFAPGGRASILMRWIELSSVRSFAKNASSGREGRNKTLKLGMLTMGLRMTSAPCFEHRSHEIRDGDNGKIEPGDYGCDKIQ